MAPIFNVLSVILTALSAVDAARILSAPKGAETVPDGYIVVMKKGVSSRDFNSHREWITRVHKRSISRRSGNVLGGMKHVYKFAGNMQGYAGKFDKRTIDEIAKRDEVDFIEPDTIVKAYGFETQPDAPTWGLGRVSAMEPGVKDYVYDSSAGEGVTAYVVDTGIDIEHPEFEGRAIWGTNTVDDDDTDGNGHGTHVAGTIASKTYGLAKKARVVASKVLNASGSGSNSGVIAGMEWAVEHAGGNGTIGKTVMNMSLGGARSESTNQAAAAVVQAGMFLAVAAGNDNEDAEGSSPASEPTVCTAAASTINDGKASFSNYGQIIDVYGPGAEILSTWPGGDTETLSGTSMASPHVAGLGAYLIALEGISGGAVCDRIKELANDKIQNPGQGTTGALIYNGAGSGGN